MFRNKNIAALVPAFNEEALIGDVIKEMPEFIDFIIVVDDCSTDSTSKQAEKYATKKTFVIRHNRNTGLGGAIKTAINKAKELHVEIAVVMGGDNQMDPLYLPALLDPICDGSYDFTKLNRFYSVDGFSNMPRHRFFGSLVLAFFTRIASGYWHIIDPQNGYVAYGPRVLSELNFNRITDGYALENDILINLNILDMKIKEIPGKIRYGKEASNMKLWKIIPSFSIFLFFGFFRRIFRKYFLRGIHPIILFFTTGTVLFWWGIIFGFFSWRHSSIVEQTTPTGTVMIAVLPLLVGIEMLLWTLVLDIQEEPR